MRLIPAETTWQRIAVATFVLIVSVFAYSAVQHLAVHLHADIPAVPSTPIDAFIPFSGWALIPYASLGPFLLLIAGGLDPARFRRLLRAALIAQAIAYTVFLLWPMMVGRPTTGDGALDRFALWAIDVSDLPVNTVPSLHVAYAIVAAAAHPRWWSVLWALVIVLSVLPLRQHLVMDVLTGVVLGLTAWWFSRSATSGAPSGTAQTAPQQQPEHGANQQSPHDSP